MSIRPLFSTVRPQHILGRSASSYSRPFGLIIFSAVRPHHILGRSASTRLGRSASSYSRPFGLIIFSAVRPHHILGRSASTRLGRSASSYSQPFGLNIFSAVRPHLISGPSAFCTRLHKHLRKSRSPGLISWPFNLRTVVQPRALDLSALVSSRQSGITLTKFGITRPFGLKVTCHNYTTEQSKKEPSIVVRPIKTKLAKKSVPPRATLNLVGLRTKRRPPHKDQVGEKECSPENNSQLGRPTNEEAPSERLIQHQCTHSIRPGIWTERPVIQESDVRP
ncbi:hypothetical protein VIGAN_04146400 [Vigna angularis var. angularis]|uniref:Uncharacterized protein n=1 Tax=Vigna angularis var. angularis TaxID=157739 RepID=A0A0S3RUE2_PHAAN|nr:hypothetical protein VIGAN_04146400 [Vigna angularis var. angularis]